MKNLNYDIDDLIAALATPWGESALAVIRTSGKNCIEAVSAVFENSEKMNKAAGGTLLKGYITDPDSGERIDEVVAGIYRNPKSYTGEDLVEIYTHGSLPGIRAVLAVLKKGGFRDAGPGEFTLRAFLNKKMDLTKAEAVHEIITSKSRKAQSLAMARLSGNVFDRINSMKFQLRDILSGVELQLDYAEDEDDPGAGIDPSALEAVRKELEVLASTYRIGRLYQDGVKIVLAGRTNAGKSALFNLFLKEDRSIVSDIHGTTRDYIESYISIKGVPVRLFDTAGIRDAEHPIEVEGIKRSEQIIGSSDIVIYIVDSCEGLSDEDEELLDQYGDKNIIKLWNKIDICPSRTPPDGFIPVSSFTGEGFSELEKLILETAYGGELSSLADDAVIDSERQKKHIDSASSALQEAENAVKQNVPLDLIALDLKEAMDNLGEITGEITSADILNNMFSRFCVGK
jgi:tRNA modification GTPase